MTERAKLVPACDNCLHWFSFGTGEGLKSCVQPTISGSTEECSLIQHVCPVSCW